MKTIASQFDKKMYNFLKTEYGCTKKTVATKAFRGMKSITYSESDAVIRADFYDEVIEYHRNPSRLSVNFAKLSDGLNIWNVAYAPEIDILYWWR